MNNDLISREALREDLRSFFPSEVLEGIEPKTLFTQIMHDIDNAPTVETPTIYEFKGCDNCELDRPKGEWIEYKEDNEIRYYCSNCMVTKGQAVNNFCACCGADMRGDKK